MTLPDLTNDTFVPKQKKRKRVVADSATPIQSTSNPTPATQPAGSSDPTPTQFPTRFQALFDEMKPLDESDQDLLLDRFFRQCKLVKALDQKGMTSNEVLNPSPTTSPIRPNEPIKTSHPKQATSY
ncbi:uncharacterized protein MELLADRAFT_107453 [Melampsora larici-populina 98AG31]|uniref:Uncharacterized protein n=1 Tax=Melampsora larici-populina (strain 98AG31 / pathotype 3-4-7) TaxID=747676 RepID=F4RPV5_MELLP|nr:uncharacterized protein MELLADRAFT_107453 [Melampsora larici-populina 98AG31]EGG05673.1 hypothetical protein MELLADRAFT_107453 [Melampsora larici-populina 98AG31]